MEIGETKVSPKQASFRATIRGRTQHFPFLLLDFLRFFEFSVFLGTWQRYRNPFQQTGESWQRLVNVSID